jgi:glycosyltransferase involved in cell wall biosynthesis
MPVRTDAPKLSILHVLTLNGRNGEYGGPVRVARELCSELNSRGHATHIFSGARKGSEPIPKSGLAESFVLVKPISKRLPVSSLWSWKIIKPLNKLVENADVVHIHFARDLVSFLAALLSILKKKPFVTQTHGMIISDGRTSTRLTDLFLTKPLMNRSRINLVLTEIEMSSIKTLNIKSLSKILPNGIAIDSSKKLKNLSSNRVVFCSRLDKRKGVDKFIELADVFKDTKFTFEIYGPDGGELHFVLNEITKRKLEDKVLYKGALLAHEVLNVLGGAGLLILPSKDEPFPMVILEAISIGTPVLVMPSCGIAPKLAVFNHAFVSKSEDFDGLVQSFGALQAKEFRIDKLELINFAKKHFGIDRVVDKLSTVYYAALN